MKKIMQYTPELIICFRKFSHKVVGVNILRRHTLLQVNNTWSNRDNEISRQNCRFLVENVDQVQNQKKAARIEKARPVHLSLTW